MIYLDHAATTPICEAAKQAIIEHLDDFGNPSSAHSMGYKASMLMEDARERIAKCINAEPEEIYFTSGGSEANNWAMECARYSDCFISEIEHHSILNYPEIKRFGEIIPCYPDGLIDEMTVYDELKESPKNARKFVSCMRVNNEIGTIQDIIEIADVTHDFNGIFHTDAVQGMFDIPSLIKSNDIIDMMSASAHKFGGLKGVGFLYIKNGIDVNIDFNPLIYGGKQENNKRAGTENVLGIITMAAALEDYYKHIEERSDYIRNLRDRLLFELLDDPKVYMNGTYDSKYRSYSNINVRIDGIKGQDLVAMADHYGICISAGSACNEGNPQPSHVLKAIGLTDEEALSSVRITLGHENTLEEIDYVCRTLPKLIARLRTI